MTRARLLPLLLLLLPGAAHAEDASCAAMFAGARPPAFTNPRLGQGVVLLCNDAFTSAASPVTRGALWSAEHLTAASLLAARDLPREGDFHPDDRLPPGHRGELADYRDSGFDRGHLAPNGDMPTAAAQAQSFSLANIVPQSPELNRGAWSDIEGAVRRLAERRGELYVVTGAAFLRSDVFSIGPDGVLVPTAMWKAVYDPAARAGAAYVCSNGTQPYCLTTSLAGLTAGGEVDPFPALTASARVQVLRLPTAGLGLHSPDETRRRRPPRGENGEFSRLFGR